MMKRPQARSLPKPVSRWFAFVALAILIASLPACQGGLGNRPYSAARPTYAGPNLNPMRIGGYAGYNYGPGERVIPQEAPAVVRPVLEPPLIE